MPVLKNQKWELFAQAIASNFSGREAYKRAGYEANDAACDANASKLLKNTKVRARIDQLSTKAAKKVELDKAWVLSRLMRNAKLCLGEEKATVTKIDKETGDEITRDVELYDPAGANRALELLGKELAMFIERKEVGGPGEFAKMTDEEIDRQLAEMMGEVEGSEARH